MDKIVQNPVSHFSVRVSDLDTIVSYLGRPQNEVEKNIFEKNFFIKTLILRAVSDLFYGLGEFIRGNGGVFVEETFDLHKHF